ncbi:hypothetical protein PLESTB_001861200 [Pleodorina starrii]|uniref:Uncharacterized protein n=1 Tax=Pleodorina starrii TaxID=330485 RepID=A0A9W6C2G0_9CHLO|nr:hypothetical protein PLESTM_000926300 [Pleodorina starrii]GLC62240.1 hypothetical protein PLESTB_001861200 [Pleodorina starrii]GLC70387.1 hypothetical protein PLESTF_000967500 [Pleodorina starrii]
MEAADQDGAPTEPGASDQQDAERHCLELQLHTDEAVWMRQIGHLKDWCSQTRSVKLGIPSCVATPLAASSLRLLWLFQDLQQLDITFNSTRCRIEQPVVVACAELLNLTSLRLCGGHLARRGLDLGVLTSLRRLRCLSVRPHSDEELDGLEDEHLGGAARLTGLTSLSLRASENVTDEGVMALTALTGLTQLSLVPMGLCVTREGVAALSAAMPHLQSLSVGLHECRQVAALKGLQERPRKHHHHHHHHQPQPAAVAAAASASASGGPASCPCISLVLNSPEVSTGGFFSTLTLVLRPRLVALRMTTVEATDGSFLLAVGTLAHLTELKMGVGLPEGGQPFTVNLAALASLGQLRTLELAVTQELSLPLSVKMISLLSLSWPRLRSLSLSAMTKPEVAPEALELLDNFAALTSLSLFAPLDYYASDEEPSALTLPVNPRYLPRGLTHLVLECAHLRDKPTRTGPDAPSTSAANGAPQQQNGGSGAALTAATTGANRASADRTAPSPSPSSRPSQDEAAPSACGGGSGGVPTRGSVLLPHLEQLELNSCRVSDDHLGALLSGATGMRHLELTDVRGISDAALSALSRLTRLEHLVVRISGAAGDRGAAGGAAGGAEAEAEKEAASAGGGGGVRGGGGGVSHRSLATLRNASTLRHLEWSLPEPLGAGAAEEALGGVLAGLGGLQELYLDVAPELRATTTVGGRDEGGDSGGGDGGGPGGGGGGSWRERLQRALPLCTVAERPGIVMYDLWNDRTVQVVGP